MRKWADKVMELANAERKKQNEYRAVIFRPTYTCIRTTALRFPSSPAISVHIWILRPDGRRRR